MNEPEAGSGAVSRVASLRRTLLWLGPAWAVGAALRLWGLPGQVLVGDEVHGVTSALNLTLPEILTTYRLADHCIPLASYLRVLVVSGVGLTETLIRLPSVLAGLALLVGLPLAVSRRPDPARWLRAAALAWLVAIAPSLVYYGRIGRPYAVVALLATLAAAAFWRWWWGAPLGWAVLYGASAAGAAWFHLGAVPFVAAPLVYAAGELVVRRLRGGDRRRGRGPGALITVGLGLGAGVAAFLLPAWSSFRRLLRHKAASPGPDLEDVGDALLLQAGTGWVAAAVLFWVLAGAGLASLLRRRPRSGLYGLLLVTVQWGTMALVLRPSGVAIPLVLNRYVLPALPVVVLGVAEGVVALRELCLRRGAGTLGWGGAVAAIGVLVAAGPYAAEPRLRVGPFAGSNPAIALHERPPSLPPEAVPPVYRFLAAEPGTGAVVEAVTLTASFALRPTIALSRLHGRGVVLATSHSWVSDPRLDLRTVVPAVAGPMARSEGRFVVLHLDRPRIRGIESGHGRGLAVQDPGPTSADHGAVAEARSLARDLRTAWGEPHLVSGDVLLWDLARVSPGKGRTVSDLRRHPSPVRSTSR